MTSLSTPAKLYVEKKDGDYCIAGTRISLDSIIYSFLAGESPETIGLNFPLLSLEQVYGAITLYLANQETIDSHIKQDTIEFEQLQESCRVNHPLLYNKLKRLQIIIQAEE